MSNRSTSKKVLQNFHARADLWRLFEQHARQMDCSVDYLINEAMRLYAKTQGFDAVAPAREEALPSRQGSNAGSLPAPHGGRIPRPQPTHTPPPLPRTTGGPPATSKPPIPRPSVQAPADAHFRSGSSQVSQRPVHTHVAQPHLTLIFQGRKIPILGEQFIIGRGSKSSDLAIKDANISRKHAAIILHNGVFYIKDLGSTNGIEYNGKQVDSKRIDEGDVFTICGYDLHFTYQA